MLANPSQISAGAAALKTFVDQMLTQAGEGWEEMFIPESAFTTGAQDCINAAMASSEQSDSGRLAAGAAALRAALNSTGEGSQVTDVQVADAAAAILKAAGEVA